MRRKSVSIILMILIPIMVVCFVLASSAVAQSDTARSGTRHCSNRTLSGDYGHTVEARLLGPNLLLRAVVMQHYDGRGNITQVDHVVVNGVPPAQEWTPGTGIYTVNPDCTGAAVINTPSVPAPLHIHFVVVNNGKQINQVVDSDASSAIGIRVDFDPPSRNVQRMDSQIPGGNSD
jgi:hypothetical protein